MDLPHLAGFLSGYFHQDWDVEYADADDAVAAYAQDEAGLVAITIEEIDVLRARALSDDELAAWALGIGSYYQSSEGTSFDRLLFDLRKRLKAQLG